MDYIVNVSGNLITLELTTPLTYNTEYTVTISSGMYTTVSGVAITLEEDYEFWFTSQYCPLFTTVGRIRLDLGPIIDTFLDDTIYRLIHKNSLDAVRYYNMYNGTNYPANYWGCTYENVPTELILYVECKTGYDLLTMIDLMAGGGNQTKTLGDLTITYGGSSAPSPSDKKDQLYDCWNGLLRKMDKINVTVRGFYDASKGYLHPVFEPQHNRITQHNPMVPNRHHHIHSHNGHHPYGRKNF